MFPCSSFHAAVSMQQCLCEASSASLTSENWSHIAAGLRTKCDAAKFGVILKESNCGQILQASVISWGTLPVATDMAPVHPEHKNIWFWFQFSLAFPKGKLSRLVIIR